MQAAFSKQTASRPVVTSRRCAVTVQAALKPVDAATRRNVCGALFLLAASGMGAPIAEAIELKPATKIVINHTPSAEFKEVSLACSSIQFNRWPLCLGSVISPCLHHVLTRSRVKHAIHALKQPLSSPCLLL